MLCTKPWPIFARGKATQANNEGLTEMKRFTYYAPRTLDEAVGIFQQKGDGGRVLAGGTDLVVQMKEGGMKFPYPSYLVSLRHLQELRGLSFSEGEGLRIGALATMHEVEASPVVRRRFNAIAQGAEVIGSIQIRNLATVGGNLCNAAPSADIAPPLIALGARVRIVGPEGERTLPLEEFFLAPGRTVLGPGDILVELLVPVPPPRTGAVYQRHTPRQQMDIAVVGVGVAVTLEPYRDTVQQARIVLGAVAPTPMRAVQAEAALASQPPEESVIDSVAQIASQEARPISDVRGSAAFRRELVRVMTAQLLRQAVAEARRS